ncbi:hypothetical protein [Acetobacter senegalensis]|uniref:hypothetical protein n=1 Tax=Acetobacter senegalensis TaxID=446692 RepID=UPI001EDEF7DB|nr:hypothetical protein [Acetobacter senegalensis]MCG4273932.1 hypothetical protein [Acetobacter senegalensis]
MSQTMERQSVRRLAPIPHMEPPAVSSYAEQLEDEARADEKKLEAFADMLKAAHKHALSLLNDLHFGKELNGLPETVRGLATCIANTEEDDIKKLWEYQS